MAKIRSEDIDELRERADLVEIVSAYTALKKAGANRFKALCPFHAEKTPSFTIDGARGLFYCFGCQEGGDVYSFVAKKENLPFAEAVEWVARRSGFELRYEEGRPGEAAAAGLKARIAAANGAAASFFHEQLFTAADASAARSYLESRGFGRDVAQRWQLGWAPGRDAMTRYLLARGFSPDELLKADLTRKSDRDGALYDTFRQRITFPTWNLQGDVVAFGARLLSGDGPKYLNSSETALFSKSRVMFGLHRAKSAMARNGFGIVVEGYTDVIALHEAGITEAVATNGVALGEAHFELLKKFCDRLVLMFDADEAGERATERGFGIHHRIGLEVLVAPLPPARDPAEVVREDGADALRKVLDEGQPLLEFKLEQTISRMPLDTPEARTRAVRAAAQVLGWQPDPIARHQYTFSVARRIGVDQETVQRALAERAAERSEGGSELAARERRIPGHIKVEKEALRLLATERDRAIGYADDVDEAHFSAPVRRELFDHLRSEPMTGGDAAARSLSADGTKLLAELTLAADESRAAGEDEIQEVFVRLKVFRLERDIKSRRDALQELNPLEDPERHDALFTELVQLEARRRDLLRSMPGAA